MQMVIVSRNTSFDHYIITLFSTYGTDKSISSMRCTGGYVS